MNYNAQHGFAGSRAGPCIALPYFAHSRGNSAAETRVTSCDGHAFVVRRTGHGAPILMLHDMAATQRAWDPVRDSLSCSNAVCTWDARGHGESRRTPESAVPTLGLLAADLDAAITACAPESAVLVGHGLGALTILEFLRNYDAGRVSGVVLVDQTPRMLTAPDWSLGLFGGFRAGDELEFEARIRAGFAEAWSSLQARETGPGGRTDAGMHARYGEPLHGLGGLAAGSMLALWRSMIGRDYRADLVALQIPLLVALGSGSNLYDAAQLGRWFQSFVPDAQVIRYLKADHAPHVAAPERFARDVAAFAARREALVRSPEAVASGAAGTPHLASAQAAA